MILYLFGGTAGPGDSSKLWKFDTSNHSWIIIGGVFPEDEGAVYVNGTFVWPAGRGEAAFWSSGLCE